MGSVRKSFEQSLRKKVRKWIFVVMAVVFASAAGLIATNVVIQIRNSIVHNFTFDTAIESKDESQTATVYFEIPVRSDGVKNCWESEDAWGSQYDIYIVNNSSNQLKNWTLKMYVPDGARIDSSWNGIFNHKENVITISPSLEAMNLTVLTGNNVKVGFVLYTPKLLEKSHFELSCNFVTAFNKSAAFVFFAVLLAVSLVALVVVVILFFLIKKQEEMSDHKISDLVKLCASFIDTRDEYTKMHSTHVALYSKLIAKELGYDSDFQKRIYYLGMLHDLGKVMIPREILCKPEKLTDEEWSEMKRHTTYGADITKDFNGIDGVSGAALFHHERYDGRGYMAGLSGEEIPLEARIICVADSYDAMATDRAYRLRLPQDVILSELKKGRGTQFDPAIADAMIHLIENGEIK